VYHLQAHGALQERGSERHSQEAAEARRRMNGVPTSRFVCWAHLWCLLGRHGTGRRLIIPACMSNASPAFTLAQRTGICFGLRLMFGGCDTGLAAHMAGRREQGVRASAIRITAARKDQATHQHVQHPRYTLACPRLTTANANAHAACRAIAQTGSRSAFWILSSTGPCGSLPFQMRRGPSQSTTALNTMAREIVRSDVVS
jgi:hypothetical protein